VIGPAVASTVMVLTMIGFGEAVNPLGHPRALAWALTAAEAAIGAIAYAIVLLAVDRDRRRSAMRFVALAQASLPSIVLR
jgi:hypothetical protein